MVVKSKKRDPKVGTGKKPKGSSRRLYTDENPKDTVPIKNYYNGEETVRFIVPPMHKHFHSQSCMKEWLARYSREFSNLVDNISHNMIQDNSNQEKG